LLANTSGVTSYYDQLREASINHKPSALKNELNAALHFLKFVKRVKNLAVTDPAFNATLQNRGYSLAIPIYLFIVKCT